MEQGNDVFARIDGLLKSRGRVVIAIFLQVDPAVQRARLQARYDAPRFQRATEEWIPMENAYFSSLNIPEKCDFILTMA